MIKLKQEPIKVIRFKDLPKSLQHKYRNSIIFQKQIKEVHKNFEFDAQKLRKRKIDKQKTMQEKLQEFAINQTQQKYLLGVFQILAKGGDNFGKSEIIQVIKKMGMEMTNSQIELMIWEFDEDLDKKITKKQFLTMYKKCMMDKAAAQPKKLFHLTQFMMYCREGQFRITVEDTLQLLYVRALQEADKNKLRVKDIFQDSIKIIFGEDYENQRDGVEKQITFQQYLQKINKKAIQKRKKQIEKIKAQLRYS